MQASRRPGRALLDSPLFLRLAALALFAVIWQLYAENAGILLVPTFTATVAALVDQVLSAEVWAAFWLSNQAMLLGFAAAVAAGVPLGLLTGRFHLADQVVSPYLYLVLAVPLTGLIPLLTITLGVGLGPRVLVVWTFAVTMVAVTCRAGVKQVDPQLIEMIRVFGASELGVWKRVLLPAALPAILAGVRVGLGRAIEGMVTVELIMVAVGVGGLLLEYGVLFQPAKLYAIVLLILLEALILLAFVDVAQRQLTPWSPSRGPIE